MYQYIRDGEYPFKDDPDLITRIEEFFDMYYGGY